MANAPLVTMEMINKGIFILKKNNKFDSAVSVSKYNMWSPLRARRLNSRGELKPFVPFKYFGNEKTLNCDRDSQGDVLLLICLFQLFERSVLDLCQKDYYLKNGWEKK